MENIASVTSFLKKQATDERSVLTLLPTLTGGTCHREPDGGWWRLYEFVEDSICLQAPETPADFYESAVAFGSFQQQLASFPAGSLHETIRNFHNTSDRMRIFRETLGRDPLGRAAAVQKEIDFVLAREEEAGALIRAQKAGELPLRVTHNDTKLNNVMKLGYALSTMLMICRSISKQISGPSLGRMIASASAVRSPSESR